MKRALLGILAVGLVIGACGDGDGTEAEPEPTTTTTTEAPPSSISVPGTVPVPELSTQQYATIEQGIDLIYPDVPDGKAATWAEYLCHDVLNDDLTDYGDQVNAIIWRYAGGQRPDPTVGQAEQIHTLIFEEAGYCET